MSIDGISAEDLTKTHQDKYKIYVCPRIIPNEFSCIRITPNFLQLWMISIIFLLQFMRLSETCKFHYFPQAYTLITIPLMFRFVDIKLVGRDLKRR